MKNISKFILTCLIVLLVAGCTYTERMHLKADGSGFISIEVDGSEVMQMAGEINDSGSEEIIDTTMVFRDLIDNRSDSIKQLPQEQQDFLNQLENYIARVHLDENKGIFNVDVRLDFNSIVEADDFHIFYENLSNMFSNSIEENSSRVDQSAVQTTYELQDNTFERKTQIVDLKLFNMQSDSLEIAVFSLGAMQYEIDYTFDKNIKSTTLPNAEISEDRKNLKYSVSYYDYLTQPHLLNMKVELE